jgi:hypothetical protein
MCKLAYFSSFFQLISKLYEIAHNLKNDPLYTREDAVEELLAAIEQLKESQHFLEIPDRPNGIHIKQGGDRS